MLVVVVVVVVVVAVVGVAGDRTRVAWKTGAGTSGVPAASFGGRGLTARVYPRCTEVGRAVRSKKSRCWRNFCWGLASAGRKLCTSAGSSQALWGGS